MSIDELEQIVRKAYESGSIFIAGDGNVLSREGGSAAAAALGALLETIDDRRFNVYCENQRRLTGWVSSRGNPILEQARTLLKTEHKDHAAAAALDHAWYEFVGLLVNEHVRRGGQPPDQAQTRATCAVFVAKVVWDQMLGNDQILGAHLG